MAGKMSRKKDRRRTAAAAAAVITSAGVLAGGIFDTPEDFLAPAEAITEQYDDAFGSDDEEDALEERTSLRIRARRFVLTLPWGVRAAVILPLWALGTALIALVSFLWSGLLSPLVSKFAVWLLTAGLLVLVFCCAAKLICPKIPFKKLFKRRSILPIVCGICLLAALDAVLPLFFERYASVRNALCAAGSFLLLFAVTLRFSLRERRKAEAPPAETQEEALRRVLAMADSVGKRP